MIRISWEYFLDNSFSRDALVEFVEQKRGLEWLRENCWPRACRREISHMKQLGASTARRRARRMLQREGWLGM